MGADIFGFSDFQLEFGRRHKIGKINCWKKKKTSQVINVSMLFVYQLTPLIAF